MALHEQGIIKSNRPDETPLPIEQARRVMWVAPNKIPMGELYDAGKLSRDDLAYFATKGYTANLRRASRTFLELMDRVHPVPTTTTPAKQTAMQSSRLPGTTVADAVEDIRYGPRVVVGSHYLEHEEAMRWGMIAFLLGMGAFAAIILFFTLLQGLIRHSWALVVVVSIVYGVLFLVLRRQIRRYGDELRQYRRGRHGEHLVVEQLRTVLDQRWTVYCNLKLPHHRADLDVVLVGPGGLWLLEIKSFHGPVRIHDGTWKYLQKGTWQPFDQKRDPEQQVKKNAVALSQFLDQEKMKRWIETAVVLAEPQPISNFASATIDVWFPSTLPEHVSRLTTRSLPTPQEINAINTYLTRLAERHVVEENL